MPPDVVNELLVLPVPERKLDGRGISKLEVLQILDDERDIVPNPRSRDGRRKLLVGVTHGGRVLTLVIERTHEPTTWIVITGWNSDSDERRIIDR